MQLRLYIYRTKSQNNANVETAKIKKLRIGLLSLVKIYYMSSEQILQSSIKQLNKYSIDFNYNTIPYKTSFILIKYRYIMDFDITLSETDNAVRDWILI